VLREIYIKTDNRVGGKYFAHVIKVCSKQNMPAVLFYVIVDMKRVYNTRPLSAFNFP